MIDLQFVLFLQNSFSKSMDSVPVDELSLLWLTNGSIATTIIISIVIVRVLSAKVRIYLYEQY